MTPQEMKALADGLIPVIGRAVMDARTNDAEKIAALEMRILELETRPTVNNVAGHKGEQGERGAIGERGEQGPPGMRGEQGERGIAGEKGERGDIGPPGLNGKDAEPIDVDAIVERVKALIPTPKDGRDGATGPQGERGEVGPAGKDGIDGKDGAAGERGSDGGRGELGPPGKDGEDGKDGIGIADLLIDRQGELIATFTDGRTKSIGLVVGKDGAPGAAGQNVDMASVVTLIKSELDAWPKPKDGRDGVDGMLRAEDLAFDFDGERTVVVKAKQTGVQLASWTFPNTIDRGVFEAGKSYQRGDGVTADGHFFIAKCDTVQQPGEGSTDWRLAVRRGKQGRDGKPGPQGQRGEKGDGGPQGPQGPMGRPVGV